MINRDQQDMKQPDRVKGQSMACRGTVLSKGMMAAFAFFASLVSSSLALAGSGQPSPWQINFQEAATEVMRDIHNFHMMVFWIITAISVFVLILLIIIMVRFNEKKNPVPSKTTHHTGLEIAWTIIPILILVVIAIPSFRLLKEQLTIPKADIVVKATGYAWYWGFEYPKDQGGFKFEANIVEEKDLKPGQPRLLAVDNEMVVPVNKIVNVQVTAADVLHAFAMPSFGIKVDAVPGRLNQTWFKAEREGIYYGQCSELCGARHAYMPIAIRVVSDAAYAVWLETAKKKYARLDGSSPVAVATTEPAR
jgi:cytochrome c oxidase subunit II